jgi:hypothetical protein
MGDEREEYDVKTFVVGGNLKKKKSSLLSAIMIQSYSTCMLLCADT